MIFASFSPRKQVLDPKTVHLPAESDPKVCMGDVTVCQYLGPLF